MSKAERIKAEISFHEKMFFAALAIVLTIIGWAVSYYAAVDWLLLMSAGVALLSAIGFGIWNYRHIKRLLEDLENA